MGKCWNSLRSDNNTFLSIFCEAQITSSQTGVGQWQSQKQRQRQNNQSRRTFFFLLTVVGRCFWSCFWSCFWLSSTSDTANCAGQKMDKESVVVWAAGEFQHFPIFCPAQLGSRRPVAAWSPFLGYLFWRRKKGDWLSGHPRPTDHGSTTKQIQPSLPELSRDLKQIEFQ